MLMVGMEELVVVVMMEGVGVEEESLLNIIKEILQIWLLMEELVVGQKMEKMGVL